MNRISNFTTLLFSLLTIALVHGQETVEPSPAQLEKYRQNQFEIDRNNGGIGLYLARPNFGSGVRVNRPWVGVNILADFLEIKFATGKVEKVRKIDFVQGEQLTPGFNQKTDYGYMLTVGGNIPIKALTFGKYERYNSVFRGHPILGISTGMYGIKDSIDFTSVRDYENMWIFGITPGYRIRLPYVSIDFNIEMTAGMRFGDLDEYYRAAGIYPSITLRADALKQLLNPRMVSVNYQQATVTNVESETYKSTTYSRGYKIDRYTTYTTADVNVSSGTVGVQDIGPVGGIGVKYLWQPIARQPYMGVGRMFGVNAYLRGGPMDAGLNFEGGRIGHGSTLEGKGEGEYRRKVERDDTHGVGSISMGAAYINLGIDVSSLFLMPFGIAMDKGEATSFFSASVGVVLGTHFAFDQQFDEPTVAEPIYAQEITEHPEIKPKFIDPAQHEVTGFLGGFYFSVHVGALNFTIQNNRYYGAPFASGTMYSFAYRFPFGGN
ncbi:MAG: hypothetical protein ACFHU9_08450 [Fluviicola sp.]